MKVRYAILSDVHGRQEKLAAVLDDARARGVDRIVSLGDVGGEECLALLQGAGAMAVFGNYEVSGWRRLATAYRAWVRSWPPLLAEDRFVAVHAVPWWPEGLEDVVDFGAWLKRTGQPWRALFPYLGEDGTSPGGENLLWRALTELEAAEKAILFHGHTHRQRLWRWDSSGRMREVQTKRLEVRPGEHSVVGVGSVGLPEDGGWAAYALYDAGLGQIDLVRLGRP